MIGFPMPLTRDDAGVERLGLWDVFVVLIAVAGPPKIVVAFAHLSVRNTPHALRVLALRATGLAMLCGVAIALVADPLLNLLHIKHAGVMVAGGAIFFVFALRLVLEGLAPIEGRETGEGIGPLLVPFVVSPLAMTSIIVLAEFGSGWKWSATVAVAYLAVIMIDLATVLGLTLVLHRIPQTLIEVAGRLLGLLLAAIGVELLLDGLNLMGVIHLKVRP